MEDALKEPVHLSKGINLKELLTSQTEFHIDTDFKKKKPDSILNWNNDLMSDSDEDDESDSEDVLKNIETSTEQMMLVSPEYHSFSELAAKMIDCVPSGDVKMLIIEEGDGPLVPVDAEVTLHYAAYWEKAKIPFDSTLTMNSGMPLHIRLGTGKILLGLEIGLTAVKGPKARFHLLLQPNVAWGERGALPRVRPEPALFVIVLYDVKDVQAAARFNDLPMEEQKKFEVTMKTVKSLHSQAKDLFNKKKYTKAIKNYQQSISVLRISQPQNETEESEVKKLKIVVFVNLAVCYYKINKPKYVINMCESLDHLIDIETHCKALFYYGRAYEMLGKREEALKYYNKALKLEPKNKEIGKALVDFERYIQESAKKEKEMWQAAFKSTPQKKNVVYDVDVDFQNGVIEMCQNLSGSDEYAKFELPTGLTKNEVDCIKALTDRKMIKLVFIAALVQCTISQQYQQKVAPGVPPQNYQNYQPPPPPPQPGQPPQQQQYQQPQQYQQQQQQYQQPQQPQQQHYQQQVPVQQIPVQNPPQGQAAHGDPQLLNPANIAQERDHIKEHMDVPIDTSKMSEQELQFHYFKMHDADNNDKLDGCELIKSLIHWHEQGHKQQPQPGSPPVGEKIFTDEELTNLIDPILNMDDHNRDGYIDYPEFVRAQQKTQRQDGNQ
ncbi:unnamed protein product [Parnassius apollo]|uniref:peptidylprolyl isomerase n=1 Tax=Parnassius apollo TaxID=110799 RepID=A0A8S3X4X4_PARAO|nr:unnamed protein product [Parnassius apollo]